MNIAIRKARIEDAERLAQAERKIAEEPGYLCSLPMELTPDRFAETIQETEDGKRGIYLVATLDDLVVGHGSLIRLPLSSLRHIAQLTIVVHPDSQGKGIGNRLMEALIAWAENNPEIEKLELNVRAVNERALHLYKKWGFRQEGRLAEHLKTRDGYIDEIVMGLNLRKEMPWPKLPEPIRTGVYGIALSRGKILAVQQRSGPYKGKFDLPGGKIEVGESVEEALRREFAEEVALQFQTMTFFSNMTTTISGQRGYRGSSLPFHQIGLVYTVFDLTPISKNSETYMGSHWVRLKEIEEGNASPFLLRCRQEMMGISPFQEEI